MIKQALKLREQLDTFSIYNRKELDKDFLSEQKWDELDAIHKILQPFKRVTKRLKGHCKGVKGMLKSMSIAYCQKGEAIAKSWTIECLRVRSVMY